MPRYVIMGVSGCGKTSVGQALAERVGLSFVDGDDLHPESNIAKMSSGQPLTDADRAPWLDRVGMALAERDAPAAIGCSALKRHYRDRIRAKVPGSVLFLHLAASREVLAGRVAVRTGHFMPPALLDSQFAALEPLGAGELGTVIDISQSLDEVAARSEAYVRETLGFGADGSGGSLP